MNQDNKYTKTEVDNFIFQSKHLPNCFSNEELLEKLDSILEEYENALDILNDNYILKDGNIISLKCLKNKIYNSKKGSEPINYTISKPVEGHRIMSVVNPIFLIPLHQYILEYKDFILNEQEDSNDCFSAASHYYYQDGGYVATKEYDDYIFTYYQGHYYQKSFLSNIIEKLKISNGKYHCLKIDISSFFNSIYTHTISWYLKDESYRNIFENLDYLNRSINQNETKGIVIGPYTSSLFSELVLSKVDRKLYPFFKKKSIFYQRFCDDYYIFSDSKELLESTILPMIETELSKYKLDINYSKVIIDEFPFIENKVDLQEILNNIKNIMSSNEEEIIKIERLISEIGKTLKSKYSDTNYILSYLIRNDYFKFKDSSNVKVLLNFFINIMFRNNLISKYSTSCILEIIANNEFDSDSLIDEWIEKRNNLSTNLKDVTDIWLIYIILSLNSKSELIVKYLLETLGNNQLSDILIIDYLHKNDLIEIYKEKIKNYLNNIKEDINRRYDGDYLKDCFLTKYWLLFYTNSIRWKIHTIKGFKNSILNTCYIENIIKGNPKRERELNILYKMFKLNIELFKMS